MNRLMRLVLLVSLGLNLGLGWAVLREGRPAPQLSAEGNRAWRERPASDDSVGWRRMLDRRVQRMASHLELDPAQAARLRELQAQNSPLVRARRERIEAARLQVREATEADLFDPQALRGALAGLRHAQADLDSLSQEFVMQELAVMTPAQRDRYLEMLPLELRHGGRSGGTGPREGGPGRGVPHRRRDP